MVSYRASELPLLLNEVFYHKLAALLVKKDCPNCRNLRVRLDRSQREAERDGGEKSSLEKDLNSWKTKAQSAEEENSKLQKELDTTQKELLQLKLEHLRLLIDAKNNDRAQEAFDEIEGALGKDAEKHDTILLLKHDLAGAHLAKSDYKAADQLLKKVLEERATHKDERYKASFRQRFRVLCNQGQTGLEEAELLLRKEDLDNKSWDEWKLEIGDMLASVLRDLGKYENAILHQKDVWKERKNTQGQRHPGTIRSALHLAALWRSQAEKASQDSRDNYRDYYENNNIEVVRELLTIFDERLSQELTDGVLCASYETGHYYLSRRRQDKWDVAEEFLEWSRDQKGTNRALNDAQRKQLLEDLASIYIERDFVGTLKAEDVFEALYDARRNHLGPAHDETLDCGYQLSRLFARTKQADRLLKAATIMKDVFDTKQEQFRTNGQVTKRLFEIAFLCGTLLLDVAKNPNIKHPPLGEPEVLYQMAEVAFSVVWNNGPNCPEFLRDGTFDNIIKAGHKLMECLKAQQDHVRDTAPKLSSEIWGFPPQQEVKLELGGLMGEILIRIGTCPANKAAIHILHDLWQESQDLRCGSNFGVCLTRLAEFDRAYPVLFNVKQRTADGVPDSPKCAFNLAYCLMALGLYEEARPLCENLARSLSPDDEKAKWARKSLQRIDESSNDKLNIMTKEGEIARLHDQIRDREGIIAGPHNQIVQQQQARGHTSQLRANVDEGNRRRRRS
jgi:hypothetical protein